MFTLYLHPYAADIDYYVTPNPNHIGNDNGSPDDPFVDLLTALN